MKIRVFDIDPTKGMSLSFKPEGKGAELLSEILGRLTKDDVEAVGLTKAPEIWADLHLDRDGKNVNVVGDAHVRFAPPCARCLKAVPLSLDPHFDLHYLPAIADQDHQEVELDDEELDEFTYVNDEIDVGAILNEQVLLDRPFKILCAEDCKGLCPTCGANLNVASCDCKPIAKHPGLAALADIKLKD